MEKYIALFIVAFIVGCITGTVHMQQKAIAHGVGTYCAGSNLAFSWGACDEN